MSKKKQIDRYVAQLIRIGKDIGSHNSGGWTGNELARKEGWKKRRVITKKLYELMGSK